ncbi:hypothetical protein CBL_09345 [Carabus blaptoides fortunei]
MLLIIMLSLHITTCTVDVNMPELQYLADHLQPNECRRLVAALHFKSYNQLNALDAAESQVSEDIPCLRLLLHWNSARGEGLGETHELLYRRLHQIGRDDLAEWLGNTVFYELGQELKRSLDDPFHEFVTDTTESNEVTSTHRSITAREDPYAWQPFDTICWFVIGFLCVSTIFLLFQSIYTHCKTKNKKTHERKRKRAEYQHVDQQQLNFDSESEDNTEMRSKDPALLLSGF